VIRFVLLWCLLAQDANWPDLPPALQQNADIVLAYTKDLQSDDVETSRVAAQKILDQLPQAEISAQANFVLALVDAPGFPVELLPATLTRLQLQWPGFAALLEEVLRAPAGEHDHQVAGAIYAVGQLQLEAPALVESLAAYLNNPQHVAHTRVALQAITGREFADLESFSDWWAVARDRGRLAWMVEAFDSELQLRLGLWRTHLQANPDAALLAIQENRREIRKLGYDLLPNYANLAQASANPSTEASGLKIEDIRQAVRLALKQESDDTLRIQVLEMVPTFFEGTEAIGFLEDALTCQRPGEKETAAKLLHSVRPPKLALEMVVKYLNQAYPTDSGEPKGTPEMRKALLNGLGNLARRHPAEMEALLPRLRDALPAAWEFEDSAEVLPFVYQALGSFGDETYLAILKPKVLKTKREIQQRQEILDAVVHLAQRFHHIDDLLAATESLPSGYLGAVLSDQNSAMRYKAILVLGGMKDPRATMLLVRRLQVEKEEARQRDLVKGVREAAAPGALDLLLAFQPPTFWPEYREALQKQIGTDPGLALQTGNALIARQDWEMARRILRSFPAPADADPASLVPLTRLHARVQTEWLLASGRDLKADDSEVVDAFKRLGEREKAEPTAAIWPELRGRMHRLLGQHGLAFQAFSAASNTVAEGAAYDRIALDAVSAAEAAGQFEKGAAFAANLKPLADEIARQSLSEIQTRLEQKIAAAKPKEGGKPTADGSEPPGKPDPATDEAGAPPAEASNKEKPVKPDPPVQDPAKGSGADPAKGSGADPVKDPAKGSGADPAKGGGKGGGLSLRA
jgi:hypothetical protein